MSGLPWLFDELGGQICFSETDICVAGRKAEGLFDNIGEKGKNFVPLRRREGASMFVENISEPRDKINYRVNLRGNFVIQARHDYSVTFCVLNMTTEKHGLNAADVKWVFRVTDTSFQVDEWVKPRWVSGFTDLRGLWFIFLGRSPSHGRHSRI